MTSSKGKRKAPNGMYWCNISIGDEGKCVMAEKLENGKFKAWSNSALVRMLENWHPDETKPGWRFRLCEENELIFYNC